MQKQQLCVSDDTNTITVNNVYDTFEINEIIIGETSGAGKKVWH